MIVLRDCDGFTDQNTYEELLDSHLSSTWTKVSENRSYQDRSFKTYLDTELIALPHQVSTTASMDAPLMSSVEIPVAKIHFWNRIAPAPCPRSI